LRVGSIRIVVLLIRQVTHVLAKSLQWSAKHCVIKLANYQSRDSTLNRTKTEAKRRFLKLADRVQAVKTFVERVCKLHSLAVNSLTARP
jgi:hypothetical protein